MYGAEAVDLGYLKRHWGGAYLIRYRTGRWTAQRRDGKGSVEAGSPEALLDAIRADSAAAPVPRPEPVRKGHLRSVS